MKDLNKPMGEGLKRITQNGKMPKDIKVYGNMEDQM